MKLTLLTTTLVALSLGLSVQAESTVKISGVHNCCKKCDDGILNAVKTVEGASATTDKGDVTITAKDEETARKAVAALLTAGYAGKGAASTEEAKAAHVKSATVSGVHLCCGKCVTAAEKAVKGVKGVTKVDGLAKGASTFTVEGKFTQKDLVAGLNKGGFNGSVK